MIDIKLIRTNPDFVKAAVRKREMDLDAVVDEIIEIDAKRREATGKAEAMKAQQNAVTKKIPAMKKAGEDTSAVLAEMKALSDAVRAENEKLSALEEKQQELMLSLPNLPDEDVAPGGKEQNEPLHYYKEKPSFGFEPKNHVDLCEGLGLIDYQRGAKIAGNGAWIYRGAGARLEWALLNFFIEEHLNDGYELVLLPHMPVSYTHLKRLQDAVPGYGIRQLHKGILLEFTAGLFPVWLQVTELQRYGGVLVFRGIFRKDGLQSFSEAAFFRRHVIPPFPDGF